MNHANLLLTTELNFLVCNYQDLNTHLDADTASHILVVAHMSEY